ncbi:hypothetical protein B4U80_05659 [Leptotrombidium deliense]|uniref:GOLD domain-containing protein n=1 Tax=Leptotrombidium deliense TaxID=299467 RepID=A0A443S6D9_9ACAR|nr:hypothetical protein B4U80_05659 [Leptotrombidium deliense]
MTTKAVCFWILVLVLCNSVITESPEEVKNVENNAVDETKQQLDDLSSQATNSVDVCEKSTRTPTITLNPIPEVEKQEEVSKATADQPSDQQANTNEATTVSSAPLTEKQDENLKPTEVPPAEHQQSSIGDSSTIRPPESKPDDVSKPTEPPSDQQTKESIFIRMNNRIKSLEQNLTLTNEYLEELSLRYRRQMDDMYNNFNKTVTKLKETAAKAEEIDIKQQDKLTQLQAKLNEMDEKVTLLVIEKETLHWQFIQVHIVLLFAEILIMISISSLFVRRISEKVNEMIEASKLLHLNSRHTQTPTKRYITDTGENHSPAKTKKLDGEVVIFEPSIPVLENATTKSKNRKKRKQLRFSNPENVTNSVPLCGKSNGIINKSTLQKSNSVSSLPLNGDNNYEFNPKVRRDSTTSLEESFTPSAEMVHALPNRNPFSGEMEDLEFRVHVDAHRVECFHQTVRKGHNLEVNYRVIEMSPRWQWLYVPSNVRDLTIDFIIRDTRSKVVTQEIDKQEGSHVHEVKEDGEYTICFDNSRSAVATKSVSVEVYVYSPEDDDRWGYFDEDFTFPPDVQYEDSIETIKVSSSQLQSPL